jgi:hypothetical protein
MNVFSFIGLTSLFGRSGVFVFLRNENLKASRVPGVSNRYDDSRRNLLVFIPFDIDRHGPLIIMPIVAAFCVECESGFCFCCIGNDWLEEG